MPVYVRAKQWHIRIILMMACVWIYQTASKIGRDRIMLLGILLVQLMPEKADLVSIDLKIIIIIIMLLVSLWVCLRPNQYLQSGKTLIWSLPYWKMPNLPLKRGTPRTPFFNLPFSTKCKVIPRYPLIAASLQMSSVTETVFTSASFSFNRSTRLFSSVYSTFWIARLRNLLELHYGT